ncbi:MAG TPA: CoA pyrophosphatase [Bacteroidales bacterium]|nr:CoA pyrophosphatase [Bacteroidales bacterium]
MEEFKNNLKNAIKKGLPGTEVQWMMASSDRMLKDFPKVPGPDAKQAGVLILLWPEDHSIQTVFMQRPDYVGIHGGQISFPGGKKEPGDKNLIATALREAEEETGIGTEGIEIAGMLTPLFIPVSNMIVSATVGFLKEVPVFSPDPQEVDHLIIANLDIFLKPGIIKTKPMEIRGERYDVRYFGYKDYVIWGATAMMLNELLEIIRRERISLRND